MIILDTSALIFWTLQPSLLAAKASQAIEQSDRVLISSISIWEIALKIKRGKLSMPLTTAEYIARLEQLERFEIIYVDVQTWLDNINLPWEHRDPADRTIVALAASFDCPLISSDAVMAGFYKNTIW
jgi:PIN domain nuclease of toxin-antitoxin system